MTYAFHFELCFWMDELRICNFVSLFLMFFCRLADDKLVFASLEQYILVNRTSLISDSPAVLQLVNLYSLCRSLQNKRYQISYSLEAERIVFHLLNEYDWDLGSCDIHLESLKWLFQQESISKGGWQTEITHILVRKDDIRRRQLCRNSFG